jgi:AcrR family transcriptional regulator
VDSQPRRGGRTTPEVRRAIQASRDSVGELAARYGINPKTVRRWRARASVADHKTGPKEPKSTVLGLHDEAMIVAIRRLTRLPLDDCFYALRAFIPGLTRASLHRCLRRHGVSRLPPAGGRPGRPGEFELHIQEFAAKPQPLRLVIGVERASKYIVARLTTAAAPAAASEFLQTLAQASPVGVRGVVTERPGPFTAIRGELTRACAALGLTHRAAEPCWTLDQLARLDRTMSLAALNRAAEFDPAAMGRRLEQFAGHFNRQCRLKALGGLTPEAYLGQATRGRALRPAAEPAEATAGGGRRPAARAPAGRPRDRGGAREAILQAARALLARSGPEGLSLSEVARVAGVNRGTAYQHFKSRKQLIAATAEWSSEQLYKAIFEGLSREAEGVDGRYDITEVANRLATFAMHNPEICQAWLFQMLSSPDPSKDLFWREYRGRAQRFHDTPLAQDGVDTEVFSIMQLAAAFLWPIWAQAQMRRAEDLAHFARRFAHECLRVSVFGVIRPECFPEIVARLKAEAAPALEREPAA